jgi:hypothetical protein
MVLVTVFNRQRIIGIVDLRIADAIEGIHDIGIHLQIKDRMIPHHRIPQQRRHYIHAVVPVLHQRDRVSIIVDPARGYLHHIFIGFKIGPWCGVVALHVLPFFEGRLTKGLGRKERGRNDIGQLYFYYAKVCFIRRDDIDAAAKRIGHLSDRIGNGKGIGHAEKSSHRIISGALKGVCPN